MTDRELFEKVLEAMEHLHRTGDTQVFDMCYAPELIPALKERLAQPEQEPVSLNDGRLTLYADGRIGLGTPQQPEQEHIIDCPRCGHCCPQQPERVNQCAETCERAKLCATCARGLDEQPQRTHWEGCEEVHPECRKQEQEPVVWMNPSWADPNTRGWPSDSFESLPIDGWIPLYTTPQPAPTIDKLGCVPAGDTSQERVAEAPKQRHEQEPVIQWDASAPLVMQLPSAFQQPEPRITFHPGDPMKEVMRIDRHGVRVNPEYSVDEATQHVLNALTAHIQHTINHAVAAEREACAKLCDELQSIPATEPRHCAEDIRARGNT